MANQLTYEELKQRVKKLEESERELVYRNKQLDSLVKNSGFGVVSVDKNMRIVGCNEAFEDLFLYAQNEMEGKTLDELIVSGDQIEKASAYTTTTLTGENIQGSGQRRRKDGALIDVKFSGIPITVDGEVIGAYGVYEDITALKQAEEALRENEEKYRLLADNVSDNIWMLDLGTLSFSYVSPSVVGITGYNAEEAMRRQLHDTLTPSSMKLATEMLSEELSRESRNADPSRSRTLELEQYRKDGTTVWTEVSVRFIHDTEGRPSSILGVTRDITEHKRAEEALRESEKEHRSTLNNLLVGVVVHGSDTNILLSNPEATNILGLTHEQMLGKKVIDPAWNFLHEDSTVMEVEDYPVSRVSSTKKTIHDYVLGINRPDRDYVTWVIVNATPVFFKDNELEKVIVNFAEITSQKQAEEALRESEKKYRLLVENQTDLLVKVDREGRFQFVSPSYCRMFGKPEKELLGGTFMPLVHADDRETTAKEMEKLHSPPHTAYIEQRAMTKDGWRWFAWLDTAVLDEKGNVTEIIGLGRDISERKHAEEEKKELETKLQRAQKMEAMGLMAGGVAHDLNNILSGIVSYPELLLMDLPEDSPLRKPIKTIQESGMRAADVVEDLLTIARGVASGREVLNLNTLVEEYIGCAEHQKLERIHPLSTFKTELDSELLNITGSASHVKKILMNLIVNASEAIEGKGTVTVSTMNRYLDEPLKGYEDVRTGEYVVLAISDDGSGISPQDLGRIFEPFYTKKVMGKSGTGLGLTVVWNSMQDHNGYINVKGSEKGTVFELYFPTTREEVTAEGKEIPLDNYLGQGEKILVVDDEKRQREIASGILTRLGYSAESVSSGEEAIEYVKENPVDLIVLDMVMPKGINGRKTYEKILKIRPSQKAIIASGHAKTKEVDLAQKLGVGEYIKKPYTLKKVGLAVKEELEK